MYLTFATTIIFLRSAVGTCTLTGVLPFTVIGYDHITISTNRQQLSIDEREKVPYPKSSMEREYLTWLCLSPGCHKSGLAEVTTTGAEALRAVLKTHDLLSPMCPGDLSVIDGRGEQVKTKERAA